uniref:NAD(P)(+)--arginine ADP-ribosyltransferase n=1 Tax=Oryctolagus cuniculus TaxID=9986 RepID=G1T0E4_RABIT
MWVPAVANLLLLSLGLLETIQETELDNALDSFDDQYVGCAVAMTAALPHLNLTEFQANKVYADGWPEASHKWQEHQAHQLPVGFREEHGVALLAYTANSSPLYREFNAAVGLAGCSRGHYLQHFSFKTHFLLTEALQLLRKDQWQSGCHQVFQGVKGLRFRTSGPRATVRLGCFASSSLSEDVAQKFGKDTFFVISTCGVPIQDYSASPWQSEVLIPPFETFRVINASRPEQGPVRIELQAQDKHSKYNCEYIKGEEDTPRLSTAWSLLLLLAFLAVGPFPGSPGLF